MVDRDENLWLATLGGGLIRALGFGTFENYKHADGLSRNAIWQTLHLPNGDLLIATDSKIDILRHGTRKIVPFRDYITYVLARSPDGSIWSADGLDTLVKFNTSGTMEQRYPIAYINELLTDLDGTIWCFTEKGVFTIDPNNGAEPAKLPQLTKTSPSGSLSKDGAIWFISGDDVFFKPRGGVLKKMEIAWPPPASKLLAITASGPDDLWVGGVGGLYHIRHLGTTVVGMTVFNASTIGGNDVYSLMTDRRGWIWVGTEHGIAINNGKRWVTIDSHDGLAADNLMQNAFTQAPDGTMWLGTVNGLTHVVHPERLFKTNPLRPYLSGVKVGGQPYIGNKLPYSDAPLEVFFGSLDFRDENYLRFQYRLSGIDHNWVTTTEWSARYPSLPPGTHTFEMRVVNQRTHQESTPLRITLRMAFPLWRTWPLLMFYGLTFTVLAYGLWNWRMDMVVQRTKKLERIVDEQTRQLAHQARTDSLTGLMNRRAIHEVANAIVPHANGRRKLYVMLMDIDHFKAINDVYGHLPGDDVLVEFARRLNTEMGTDEHVGRYGGEEFVSILVSEPGTVSMRTDEIRQVIERNTFSVAATALVVTFSAGVTPLKPDESLTSAIARADRALYLAKNGGRGQTIFLD